MNNAKIGAAVVGGYVLGRTKKAKLAISLGALLAGSRVRPGQLAKALDTSFLSDVRHQVRTELTDASKAAATSVLTAKAENLADALHARTVGLQEKAHPEGEPEGEKDEGESGREDEPRAEEEREDEEDRDEEDREEEDRAKGREDEGREAEGREAEGRHEERRSEERQSRARRAPARRGEGREKTRHRGSDEGSEPRKRKAAAEQSRPKSGTSRSRRQGDG
ncbi:ABC transporter substrate-binding protein [Streptomyces sp. SA15]|uniref:ABC transporter substrate-binding protein n=1 Tax=Streptomyces sp. SA15 TaxID=934019 RepID=UPI000BB0219B|nr:ABC transporter substrate-binding protein [Streptomyces sp. SA15]PAZ15341.1 ABC transporter substrate-binding protein [Streptomyces sp. SA15]